MVMLMDASYWMLALWAIFWWCLIYFMYPKLQEWNMTTHLETIVIWFAILSFFAGIGNCYMYYKYEYLTPVIEIKLSGGIG